MCRLAAWIGEPAPIEQVVIAPAHSLLTQSQDATEAKLAVNGDGFGLAWYQDEDPRPGQYRDVQPAWSDGNLPNLCRMIRSHVFLAHVRASTGTETSRLNCHPFTYGRWSFMHNGQIGGYARLRRRFEAGLPDALYELRRGSTDSELLFLMMLDAGLETDPEGAVARVAARIRAARVPQDKPDRITCVMSDGANIYALRLASDQLAPTLYHRTDAQGTLVASEPLEAGQAGWQAFKRDGLAIVSAKGVQYQDLHACA
ncbi:class II glutamine amidotransferase [uncultured Litoreibacter sp.]|uniref:class II glutamine amidotransferase n=1 Tax=uncultured Litoreibacter sp. TaxID=1392394 RepID=UPI00262A7E04|nr:class II glutamine amidotransferase [uncultured Litoreibacter sp.]